MRRLVFKSAYADLPEYLQGFAYTTAGAADPGGPGAGGLRAGPGQPGRGRALHRGALRAAAAPERAHVLHRGHGGAGPRPGAGQGGVQRPQRGARAGRTALRVRHHRLRHAHVRRPASPSISTTCSSVHAHSERKWVFSLASMELVRAAVEARDRLGLPIVGFDLAGAEAGYPAGDHARGLRPGPQELPQEDRARRRGLRPGEHLPGHHRPARRPHRPRPSTSSTTT